MFSKGSFTKFTTEGAESVLHALARRNRNQRVVGLDGRDDSDKPLADVVNHDVEALDCAHAEKREVAVFRKDHLVDDGEAFGGEDGVANITLDDALVGGHVASFTLGRDARVLKGLSREPRVLRACVNHGLDRRRAALRVEGVDGGQVDHEFAHLFLLGFDCITAIRHGDGICFEKSDRCHVFSHKSHKKKIHHGVTRREDCCPSDSLEDTE